MPDAGMNHYTCQACGKQCFWTRKDARHAARLLYPGARMRVYKCEGNVMAWHLTSQSAQRAAKFKDYNMPS